MSYLRRLLADEIDHFSQKKRYIAKDGRTIWANLTVQLQKAEAEPYFISMIEDISKRNHQETG